jgi:aspartyl-tRNA synthetase
MKKSHEYLTNSDYTTMLRRIGLSTNSLSLYLIKKEMEKHDSPESQTPYVYEMTKNLRPYRKRQFLPLYRLDRIPGDSEDEYKLISALDKYFHLSLTYNKEDIEFEKKKYNKKDTEFGKIDYSIVFKDKRRNIMIIIEKNVDVISQGTLKITVENKRTELFPLSYTKEGIPFLDINTHLRNLKLRLAYLDQYYRPETIEPSLVIWYEPSIY